MPKPKRPENRWQCWWPFALLCLLGASTWLLTDAWPDIASTLGTQAAACALAALACGGVAVVRRNSLPTAWLAGKLLLVGAGLLGAPSLGSVFTGAAHNTYNRSVSFCLVPTILGVMLNVRDDRTDVLPTPWPGLAGLAGALLLLPLVPPHTVAGWLGLAGPPIAVAGACVVARRVAGENSAAWAMTLMFAGGAAFLGALLWLVRVTRPGDEQPLTAAALGLDLLTTVLVVLAVLRLNPARYASRYLVLAALTIVEGLVVLRPHFSFRTYEGLLLMLVGAVALWRVGEGRQEPTALHLG